MKMILTAVAAAAACASCAGATTVAWNFQGTYSGSGLMTYDDSSDVVTALSGTYNNQMLSLVTLAADPNNSGAQIGSNGDGTSTYRGVPNTGGANYQYDDLFHQTSSTFAILASTGTGSSEIVYALFGDPNARPNYEFFHIVTLPQYSYVEDTGTFSSQAVVAGVPEPSTWMAMVGGFGLLGATMRRRRAAASVA